MSNTCLYLIPERPDHVPDSKAAEQARSLLQSFLPAAGEVKATLTGIPVFVEAGDHPELVACPQCGQNAGKWWDEAMAAYRQNGTASFVVVTPCCGKRTSLDGLHYRPAAGFARFVLAAHNPGRALTRKERQQLSQSLGCNLREVSAAA